jgi:putative spermidine/putrescine transport system permease protein
MNARSRPSASIAVLALWIAAPLLPVAVASLGRGWFFPALIPDFSVSSYLYAFSQYSGVPHALFTSMVTAAAVALLSVIVGVPAGRALALHAGRGRAAIETLVLAPALVPGIAVAMGLATLLARTGLSGTAAGVVLVHLVPALPYAVLIPAAAFAAHRTAYEDQARTLGAGRLQTLRHVTLPMIAPAVAVTAGLCFLVSWSQVGLTLLAGGGRVVTLPMILTQFVAAGRPDVAGAVAVLTVVPAVAALVVTGRLVARPGRAT